MSILELAAYFSDLLPIVISILFFFHKKKIGLSLLWVILFYCFYSLINNSIVLYKSNHTQDSSLYIYIFTIIEYSLFASFIYTVLHNSYLKKVLLICSFLFVSFCLFNIFFQPKYKFDSLQTSIESLILLIFCIIFLFEQINKPELVFIYASYKFWVITGILVYIATTFFLYIFAASLPLKQAQEYWVISHVSNILRNIFFATAIIINVNSQKTQKPQKPLEGGYQPFLN